MEYDPAFPTDEPESDEGKSLLDLAAIPLPGSGKKNRKTLPVSRARQQSDFLNIPLPGQNNVPPTLPPFALAHVSSPDHIEMPISNPVPAQLPPPIITNQPPPPPQQISQPPPPPVIKDEPSQGPVKFSIKSNLKSVGEEGGGETSGIFDTAADLKTVHKLSLPVPKRSKPMTLPVGVLLAKKVETPQAVVEVKQELFMPSKYDEQELTQLAEQITLPPAVSIAPRSIPSLMNLDIQPANPALANMTSLPAMPSLTPQLLHLAYIPQKLRSAQMISQPLIANPEVAKRMQEEEAKRNKGRSRSRSRSKGRSRRSRSRKRSRSRSKRRSRSRRRSRSGRRSRRHRSSSHSSGGSPRRKEGRSKRHRSGSGRRRSRRSRSKEKKNDSDSRKKRSRSKDKSSSKSRRDFDGKDAKKSSSDRHKSDGDKGKSDKSSSRKDSSRHNSKQKRSSSPHQEKHEKRARSRSPKKDDQYDSALSMCNNPEEVTQENMDVSNADHHVDQHTEEKIEMDTTEKPLENPTQSVKDETITCERKESPIKDNGVDNISAVTVNNKDLRLEILEKVNKDEAAILKKVSKESTKRVAKNSNEDDNIDKSNMNAVITKESTEPVTVNTESNEVISKVVTKEYDDLKKVIECKSVKPEKLSSPKIKETSAVKDVMKKSSASNKEKYSNVDKSKQDKGISVGDQEEISTEHVPKNSSDTKKTKDKTDTVKAVKDDKQKNDVASPKKLKSSEECRDPKRFETRNRDRSKSKDDDKRNTKITRSSDQKDNKISTTKNRTESNKDKVHVENKGKEKEVKEAENIHPGANEDITECRHIIIKTFSDESNHIIDELQKDVEVHKGIIDGSKAEESSGKDVSTVINKIDDFFNASTEISEKNTPYKDGSTDQCLKNNTELKDKNLEKEMSVSSDQSDTITKNSKKKKIPKSKRGKSEIIKSPHEIRNKSSPNNRKEISIDEKNDQHDAKKKSSKNHENKQRPSPLSSPLSAHHRSVSRSPSKDHNIVSKSPAKRRGSITLSPVRRRRSVSTDKRHVSVTRSPTRGRQNESRSSAKRRSSVVRSPVRRRKSVSKSPVRRRKSGSVSPVRRRKSGSRSPVRRRKSGSRSPVRRRKSKSRSLVRRRKSKSRSPVRHRKSASRSPVRRRRIRSKSPVRRRKIGSKSPVRRRGSGSRSTVRRRKNFSRSPVIKRKSVSKSPIRRRKGGSRSPVRRRKSGSRSPVRRRKSGSRSPVRRRKGGSRSPIRRRKSGSMSPVRRRKSGSRSPVRRRKSGSRSPLRRRKSGSRSLVRRRKSMSRSPVRRRKSESRSPVKRHRSRSCSTHLKVSLSRRQVSLSKSRDASPRHTRKSRSPSPKRRFRRRSRSTSQNRLSMSGSRRQRKPSTSRHISSSPLKPSIFKSRTILPRSFSTESSESSHSSIVKKSEPVKPAESPINSDAVPVVPVTVIQEIIQPDHASVQPVQQVAHAVFQQQEHTRTTYSQEYLAQNTSQQYQWPAMYSQQPEYVAMNVASAGNSYLHNGTLAYPDADMGSTYHPSLVQQPLVDESCVLQQQQLYVDHHQPIAYYQLAEEATPTLDTNTSMGETGEEEEQLPGRDDEMEIDDSEEDMMMEEGDGRSEVEVIIDDQDHPSIMADELSDRECEDEEDSVKLNDSILEPDDPFSLFGDAPRPLYTHIDDNDYLVRSSRSRNKLETTRWVCDCTVPNPDEAAKGVKACGGDCINRVLNIECGPRCPADEFCTNRQFQERAYGPSEPFYAGADKGWGLRAKTEIKAGTFLTEYVGEVIDFREFKRRIQAYERAGQAHHYFMALEAETFIDAGTKGNWARFVNHSCEPNSETQKWNVMGKIRIGFFTKRDLLPNEEITIDYQFVQYGRQEQKCYCGTPSCKGVMGSTSKQLQDKVRTKDTRVVERRLTRLLGLTSLKRTEDVRQLLQVMVQEYLLRDTRLSLLELVSGTSSVECLSLFRQYNGLELIAAYMRDSDSQDWPLKKQLLVCLDHLPIPELKQVKSGSNLFDIIDQWSVDPKYCRRRHHQQATSDLQDSVATVQPTSGSDTSAVAVADVRRSSSCSGDVDEVISMMNGPHSDTMDSTEESVSESRTGAVDMETGEKQGFETDPVLKEGVRQMAADILDKWKQLPEEIYRIPKTERQETEEALKTDINPDNRSVLRGSQLPGMSWGFKKKSSNSGKSKSGSVAASPRLPREEFRRLFEMYVRMEEEKKATAVQQKEQAAAAAVELEDDDIKGLTSLDPDSPEAVEKVQKLLSRTLIKSIEQLKSGVSASETGLPPELCSLAQRVDVQKLCEQLKQTDSSQLMSLLTGAGQDDANSTSSGHVTQKQSTPSDPIGILPPNWKWARTGEGRVYFYHSVTKRTQWETPVYPWDSGEKDPYAYDFNGASKHQVSHEEIAVMYERLKLVFRRKQQLARQKKKQKKKHKKAAGGGKQKKIFAKEMYHLVIEFLRPYREETCKQGRITSDSDMKYLAKKLSQTILQKELKLIRHIDDLEVNAIVRSKALAYINKYLATRGPVYERHQVRASLGVTTTASGIGEDADGSGEFEFSP